MSCVRHTDREIISFTSSAVGLSPTAHNGAERNSPSTPSEAPPKYFRPSFTASTVARGLPRRLWNSGFAANQGPGSED